jgi:hypothetical protein
MLTSLTLLAAVALAPAQNGLKLSGGRVTYGELGAPRTDLKFLPGDIFFFCFEIDGLMVDKTGKVRYSMGMEVINNKTGMPTFKEKPQMRDDDVLPLGGSKLPARAYVTIGINQEAGSYTCRVTVVDDASKATQTIEQKFEVIAKGFGLVQVFTTYDSKGEIFAPSYGIAGQTIYVRFSLVGFTRDPKTKQPNLEVEVSVLDNAGKPTLPQPSVDVINDRVDVDLDLIHSNFRLPLNRAGDYTIQLKATDKISKATSKVELPLKVIAPPN